MLDQTRTNAEGAYAFRSNLPSKVSLHVSMEGYGFTVVRDIVVSETGTVVDVELAEAAKLRLRVTDPLGNPVAGNLLIDVDPAVTGQGSNMSTNVFLDSDGRGYYDEILPGAYELRFSAKGIGQAQVEVTLDPGENNLQIQLRQSDR